MVSCSETKYGVEGGVGVVLLQFNLIFVESNWPIDCRSSCYYRVSSSCVALMMCYETL